MSVNCDRVCRLCLSSRGELVPIFPTTSSDESEPPVLASKIKDCVSVQISENDDLPTNVCRKCVDNVNNWHIFKTVCERTQNKLELLIKKDGSQLEEIKIKSEPLSDGAYDDGVVIDGSYPDNDNAAGSAKLQPEGPPILASLGLTPRSDKKIIDPRMDWQRVHAILDIIQDDDVIDSLQSIEECDVVRQSDHDSESESELHSEIDDNFVDFKNGYICKNKKLLSKYPKLSTSVINAKNKHASFLRKRRIEEPKHCLQPKHAWQMLFTDDLLELVVISTNNKILKMGHGIASSTNVSEIKTLIGILYLIGVMRPTHQLGSDHWDKEFGVPCIRSTMKHNRFKFLLQNMCFENDADDSIIKFDIMKRMRKVFEIFALNCRASFEISNNAVIDEIIVPVYGPCPFRYENKSKPLKCGLKLVLLVDPNNFYISNLDVIVDSYFGPEEIVKKMTQHLSGTGRTIVMDSWFTSLHLMDSLRKEYELYTVGALHPDNDIIPPVFLSKYRKMDTHLTGFFDDNIQLTSYISKDLKSSNVITNEPMFYKRGYSNSKNTSVIASYKKNQSAVEVVDVLMQYYTTMQHTNDWTCSLFFTLLNIASVNAQVIWSSQNSSQVMKRRSFITELAISLLEYQEPSSSLFDMPLKRKYTVPLLKNSYKNRRRCRICVKTTKRDRRTKQYCMKCGQFICREHTVTICIVCSS